ncbi:SNF2-related protein [Anatilimnocola sp. NA78]|uniref:SNF2-related protein n=1 Tax=Anatilimnocola sp. NA78 TaxID=3415683 RepID=UPI003CE4981E
MRTYGKIWLQDDVWHLECEPHVAMWAKRVFTRLGKGAAGVLKLTNSDAVCRDLEWFVQRFPLEIDNHSALLSGSARHVEKILTLNEIVGESYTPREFKLALPPRAYQSTAAELYLAQGHLLLADDVGIGKTVSAIAALCDKRTQPAAIVTLAHLPKQWEKEINRFAPDLFTHVIKKGKYYPLPVRDKRKPDVLILNYHKLPGWADVICDYCESVTYDEVQELRHNDTYKYQSASAIADVVAYRLGLSATPIYNFGGEIFNVISALKPGVLGTREEFSIEWTEGGDERKQRLKDPAAFGSFLREQHIMLRRTRKDVGRELPALQRIIQEVDSDAAVFNDIEDAASQLARIVLDRGPSLRGDKMQAAGELDAMLRQATGVAKAPYVAAVVRMLLDSGERVLLYGWHRTVYDIWLAKLKDFRPALYTGSESPSKKQAECQRFVKGETPLLIMSLRSGAGLDGLQHCCRTTVFGELDWSPGVHEQCIGRVLRDGQPDPVAAYFLLAEDGSDPIVAQTLGLKREQIDGLRDLKAADLERLDAGGANIQQLAQQYLAKRGHRLQEGS